MATNETETPSTSHQKRGSNKMRETSSSSPQKGISNKMKEPPSTSPERRASNKMKETPLNSPERRAISKMRVKRRNKPERKTWVPPDKQNDDTEIDTLDIRKRYGSDLRKVDSRSSAASSNPDTDGSEHRLIAFTTDDFKIKRMVSSTSDLPLNKYTSLGAIFQNKNIAQTLSQYSYPVIKTPKDTLVRHHILGPLPPGKPEIEPSAPVDPEDVLSKLPPQQFPEGERPDAIRVGKPHIGEDMWDPTKTPHDGVVWPLAWAPRPPYATPGYNRKGVKQPVGVIQVERVPVAASRGNTDTGSDDLPTWVSPLYRPYGIGGPYGPFGPFYEPPSIDNVVVDKLAKVEPLNRPKKCLLMRLWAGLQNKRIVTADKNIGTFLNMMDEKLLSIRTLLRAADRDEKKRVMVVVQGLAAVLDDAKDFESKLDLALEHTADIRHSYDSEEDLTTVSSRM